MHTIFLCFIFYFRHFVAFAIGFSVVYVSTVGLSSIESLPYLSRLFFLGNIVSIVAFVSIIFLLVSRQVLKISNIDLIVLLSLLVSVLHRGNFEYSYFGISHWELYTLSLIYFLTRLAGVHVLLSTVFIGISCVIESAIGQLQVLHMIRSNHYLFTITGSFDNPGPYAGYLVASMPILILAPLWKFNIEENLVYLVSGLKTKFTTQIVHFLCYSSLGITIIMLLSAQSKAAWVALIANVLFLASTYQSGIIKKLQADIRKKLLNALISILIIATILYFISGEGSSIGRLSMLQSSFLLFWDYPILGVGFDNFSAHFMNYRADYFSTNRPFREIMSADNIAYSFCEPLGYLIENGLLISSIILILFCRSYLLIQRNILNKLNDKISIESTLVTVALCGIISIGFFSLFSYPSRVLQIKMLWFIYLAILSPNSGTVLIVPSKGRIFFTFILAFLLYLYVDHFHRFNTAIKDWRKANTLFEEGLNDRSIKFYQKSSLILKNDGYFLFQYSRALYRTGDYEQAIKILERAQKYLPSYYLQNLLGDAKIARGQYLDAEKAFKVAGLMIPNRLLPKYNLANLYWKTGKIDQFKKIADDILQSPIKVKSSATKEIRQEITEKLLNIDSLDKIK